MAEIGIIGVGHLAEYLLRGLLQAGTAAERILLSPRGHGAKLAASHGFALARDNAEVAAKAPLIVLTVRPAQAEEAVAGLPWRAGQVMVSACAGVPLARLRPLVGPATVLRAMPISAVAVCASPTALYPDEPCARALFARLGEVLPLRDEAEFEAATVSAAVYGWVHDLIGRSAAWSEAAGLDPTTARRLAALTFGAAARMVVADEEKSVTALVASLATPGGITERGLRVLQEREVAPAWDAACDAVLAHLRRIGDRRS